MLSIEPSKKQQAIIDQLVNGTNVIATAVAGCGKSSVVYFLAQQTKKKILLITYNRVLSDTSKEKIHQYQLEEYISSYTIHGYASHIAKINHLANPTINDETTFEKFLLSSWKIKEHYDFIVFDEVQDATCQYMVFFKKIWQLLNYPTFLVLGDPRQTIYMNKGASSNFLKQFDYFFATANHPIKVHFMQLDESFRVPTNICNCLNECFIKDDYIHGKNDGGIIKVHICDGNGKQVKFISVCMVVERFIKEMMARYHASLNDFYILCFSIKQRKVSTLANYLNNHGLFTYLPNNDDHKVDKEECSNRIVFSTVHQAKGCEKPYVILPFFDVESYANFLGSDEEYQAFSMQIPNLHYVALTRASKELLVVLYNGEIGEFYVNNHPALEGSNNLLPYVNYAQLDPDLEYENLYKWHESIPLRLLVVEPSECIKFVNDDMVKRIDYAIGKLPDYHENPVLYNLENLKHELTNNNMIFKQELDVLNAFYLLMEYTKTQNYQYFKKSLEEFYSQLNLWSTIDVNKWASKDLIIKNYKLWNEQFTNSHQSILDWYEHARVKDKLHFWNLVISLSQEINGNLLLEDYSWLDQFDQYDKINALFKQFNIHTYAYEQPLMLELGMVDNQYTVHVAYSDLINERYIDNSLFDNDLFRQWKIFYKGRVDLINKNTLFELKCTTTLDTQHKAQTMMYLFAINLLQKHFDWSFDWLKLTYEQYEKISATLVKNARVKAIFQMFSRYLHQVNTKLSENNFAQLKIEFWEHLQLWEPLLCFKCENAVLLDYENGQSITFSNDENAINKIAQLILLAKMQTNNMEKTFDECWREFKSQWVKYFGQVE